MLNITIHKTDAPKEKPAKGTALGFGVAGFWWAMVADLGVRSLLLYVRFHRGRWVHAKV